MRSGREVQRGFTYLAALILVALLGGGLAAYGEAATRTQQREKEAELAWIGSQFREAIGLYYQRAPGATKRYPVKLDDLLEDKRFLTKQRYLRRIYMDPVSGKSEWGLVLAPEGGIRGVHSVADGAALGSGLAYRDWHFTYDPPLQR